jgi:hypothetical protein
MSILVMYVHMKDNLSKFPNVYIHQHNLLKILENVNGDGIILAPNEILTLDNLRSSNV